MDSNRKIFIVGNSRSGTTMLGRMMGLHPLVHTFGELHFFEQMVDANTVTGRTEWTEERLLPMLERLLTSSREGLFTPISLGTYQQQARAVLAAAPSRNPVTVYETFLLSETRQAGMQIPCEQTPRYLYQAEEILEAFPDARMICMVRDPRAVLLSQKNKWRRRKLGASNMPAFWAFRAWVNYHPYTMSRMWASASRRARRFNHHPRFRAIRFEDIIAAPEPNLRAICAFLEIDFAPEMLRIKQIGSSTGQDRPDQLGVDPSRADFWRQGGLKPVEIALCERTAADEMAIWGYKASGHRASLFAFSGAMAGFVAKSFAALVLNFRRNKNLLETIRRRLS